LIKGLVQERKDTWEHLVAELTEKYASSSAEERARAFQKAMKSKQKSDEELRTYATGAKKLAKKVDPALEKAVAKQFVHGIRNKNLRVMVAANSQSKTDYTFKDVYQAVARARRQDLDSDSDSDSDSSSSSSSVATDSSMRGGSRRHHDAQRPKASKVEVVLVKMPAPASPNPSFNMDELAKLMKEAVQATTRELVGWYGLGPGPVLGRRCENKRDEARQKHSRETECLGQNSRLGCTTDD
jgi:soluble cytochrome b562